MPASRQPELTVKFTEVPTLPAEGKKAEVTFTSENGIQITATVTRKNAAKQLKKIEEFEDWIGALSGKVLEVSDGAIILESASIQVFEKKKKQPLEEG